MEKKTKWLRTSRLCERYDCVSRTIDRRVKSGELPAPAYINGLRYWDEAELDKWDEAVKARAAS